jgi:hypothetical protein
MSLQYYGNQQADNDSCALLKVPKAGRSQGSSGSVETRLQDG